MGLKLDEYATFKYFDKSNLQLAIYNWFYNRHKV